MTKTKAKKPNKAKGKKHHGATHTTPETTLVRAQEAWNMRARGMTQSDIAEKLKVSQASVSKMLKQARDLYHKYFVKRVEQVQGEHIALCNEIISEAMAAWYRSAPATDKNPNGQPDPDRNPHGNPEHLHVVIRAVDRLAKIIGFDAIRKTEIKSDNTNKNENQLTTFTITIPNANQLDNAGGEIEKGENKTAGS